MTHPAAELQMAVFAALNASSELSTLIGNARVFDEVPQNIRPPYVTFGQSKHTDWSTDTETGMEHEIELVAWSRQKGRKEIYAIHQILVDVLAGMGSALPTHALVNLTYERSEIIPQIKDQLYQGKCIFRAVTEPNI